MLCYALLSSYQYIDLPKLIAFVLYLQVINYLLSVIQLLMNHSP